ncbi:MAG: chemotaxis protein CheW [Gemmatimonadota bacterium]|nr:chemotaxis protein CheW [Gemmatimonadota bacterium]MDE3129413.1 chemotaxis protein CheW [Gemmatimonadota bacterium]MDE3173709.1 chemotaxis protein CheW [Gemmatimonadota bacterium]MDE3215586.1 chemotaxis protein CheW [Gemmatimonadota bacterium]
MTKPRTVKIVSFRLGNDFFAADIFTVERVLRYQAPVVVPNVPAWIEGVIEYQGRVVPVINLRRRFQMAGAPPTGDTRILVLKAGPEWIGAVVDAVLEVTAFDEAQLSPPPTLFRGLAAEYLRGIVRLGDRLLIYLAMDRLLSSDEQLTLERVAEEALPHG